MGKTNKASVKRKWMKMSGTRFQLIIYQYLADTRKPETDYKVCHIQINMSKCAAVEMIVQNSNKLLYT